MNCLRCGNDIFECICSDKSDRLKILSENGILPSRKCIICNKHHLSCKCNNPTFKSHTFVLKKKWDLKHPDNKIGER